VVLGNDVGGVRPFSDEVRTLDPTAVREITRGLSGR
jgi:hypothetical protein